MKKTFLFYDIETTGLHKAFDQILTFAAIRTDLGLKELERVSVVVQLRCDVVPSPGAFTTHRLSLKSLARGVCEYQAARQIHELVNAPGTISLGYNTLGFDDEFLRFTFYRNLLDPYTHQYANGCGRMDILPLAVLYRLFAPLDIHWPVDDDGAPSMKLEYISRDNALVTSGRAHDAMTDVEATLELARRLFARRDMWDFCLNFFTKPGESRNMARLEQLAIGETGTFCLGIMVSVAFGGQRQYMAPVLGIGASRVYGNQTLWLRLDLPGFPGGTNEPESPDKVFIIRKKNGEPPVILPPLDRFRNRLTSEQQALVTQNLSALATHPQWFSRLIEYHRDYAYPLVPDVDVDAGLYQDGFFSSGEKREMAAFHLAGEGQHMARVCKMSHARVRSLAARIVFRNFPREIPSEGLSQTTGFHEADYMERVRCMPGHEPIKGYRNETRYGVIQAEEEIKKMLTGEQSGIFDDEQVALLEEIKHHIRGM
ncbi:exonuclease domain-containing protein [Desulfocicer niacini]